MIKGMSKESSPASQSKPILALETEETVTPVSHSITLTKLMAEHKRDGATADFSPLHGTKGFPSGGLPSPIHYQYHQSSDDGGLTTDGSTSESTSHKKR